MAGLSNGAELPSQSSEARGHGAHMHPQPEDYGGTGKDFTAVKIICLGDSAVGKSK